MSPDESEEEVELTEPESDPYLASSPNTIIYNSEKGNDSPVTSFFLTAKDYCKSDKEYAPFLHNKLDDVYEDESSYDSIDQIEDTSNRSDSIASTPEEQKQTEEDFIQKSEFIRISPSKQSAQNPTPDFLPQYDTDLAQDFHKPNKNLSSSIYFDFEIRMQEIEKDKLNRDKHKEQAKALIKQKILNAIKPDKLFTYETPTSDQSEMSLPTYPEEPKYEFISTARFNTAEDRESPKENEDVSLVNIASYRRIPDISAESYKKSIVISDLIDENM